MQSREKDEQTDYLSRTLPYLEETRYVRTETRLNSVRDRSQLPWRHRIIDKFQRILQEILIILFCLN